jgi:hypothetical protein
LPPRRHQPVSDRANEKKSGSGGSPKQGRDTLKWWADIDRHASAPATDIDWGLVRAAIASGLDAWTYCRGDRTKYNRLIHAAGRCCIDIDDRGSPRDPTPEQIRERCEQVQATWTPEDRLKRRDQSARIGDKGALKSQYYEDSGELLERVQLGVEVTPGVLN